MQQAAAAQMGAALEKVVRAEAEAAKVATANATVTVLKETATVKGTSVAKQKIVLECHCRTPINQGGSRILPLGTTKRKHQLQ